MKQPFIPAQQNLPEITLKVVLLSIFLALLLSATNTYLALKIGILTSASIPAAVLSMAILRFFSHSNILQNNLVQTAASAGEAVAGGIVYTVPALIILHYWTHFGYWENFFIGVTGGTLGVIFSVPLRHLLVNEPGLSFPEGKAIAAVLQAEASQELGVREIFLGGAVGALLEFAQTGLKVIASTFQSWFITGPTIIGFGSGFSTTLIAAGYLVGFNVGCSIFIGALTTWLIGVPMVTYFTHVALNQGVTAAAIVANLQGELRYIGVGAMLTAGVWTLLTLFKSFATSLRLSLKVANPTPYKSLARTERDIPRPILAIALIILGLATYFLFNAILPLAALNLATTFKIPFLLACLSYVLIIGFIFVVICSYFSGLVGVSASPGSAVIIGGILISALLLRVFLTALPIIFSPHQLLDAAAIIIIMGAVVTGAACIANDNIQDLKVGHILGATPWKQQIMLVLGVIIAASMAPVVMNLLFNAYGIADVVPRVGMDPTKTLPAPPAAVMAALTQAVFNYQLPWRYLGIGAAIISGVVVFNPLLKKYNASVSVLAYAIGMYLPLDSSMPLFIGSMMAFIVQHGVASVDVQQRQRRLQFSTILACGIVAGSALMDVALTIPVAATQNPELFKIMPPYLNSLAVVLALLMVAALGRWFYKTATAKRL